jgi:hypothetical protein
MTMATLTTAIYILSRSHERNVRSLAQWSRASEDSLGKRRGAKTGRKRKGWEVDELLWSASTTRSGDVSHGSMVIARVLRGSIISATEGIVEQVYKYVSKDMFGGEYL